MKTKEEYLIEAQNLIQHVTYHIEHLIPKNNPWPADVIAGNAVIAALAHLKETGRL